MISKRKLFLAVLLLVSVIVKAQTDISWWTQIHNWDGHTPWIKYLTYSAKYLGPNALPVPEINKGLVGTVGSIELAAEGHFSKGDNTQNLFTKLYYPIVGKLIAIEAYVVPIEHFKMDTATRDIRAARIKSGEGSAGGDIYFATIIQLVKNKKFPDLAFRMTCRTASGTNVSAARYTDAPGYFLDLSMGKNYNLGASSKLVLRPFAMIGFYSWQTNNDAHMQDDAFLYGAGIDIASEKIRLSASTGGYIGYIKDHDRPVVARLSILKLGNHFDCGISAQAGINDYPYNSIKLSVVYKLPKKLMLKNGS
jgi:hypothetical protein